MAAPWIDLAIPFPVCQQKKDEKIHIVLNSKTRAPTSRRWALRRAGRRFWLWLSQLAKYTKRKKKLFIFRPLWSMRSWDYHNTRNDPINNRRTFFSPYNNNIEALDIYFREGTSLTHQRSPWGFWFLTRQLPVNKRNSIFSFSIHVCTQ